MTEITAKKFLTITTSAEETYKIDYVNLPRLNILNMTGGEIKIGTNSVMTGDGTSAPYITLPDGAATNNIAFPYSAIYIYAEAAGKITIERCD